MRIARKSVKDNKDIKKMFLESSKESDLEENKKMDLLNKLTDKVCNARFGAVLRQYKDHETGRRGVNRSDTSLRAGLKAR